MELEILETSFRHVHYADCRLINGEPSWPGPQMELAVKIKKLRKKRFLPVMQYQLKDQGKTFVVIPDQFRQIFRGIIHLVVDLHSKKRCTRGFNREDVVFNDKIVQIQNVKMILNPNQAQMQVDYNSLHSIISSIVTDCITNNRFPYTVERDFPDLHDLLQLLLNPGNLGHKLRHQLVVHHLAVLPRWERFNFIMEVKTNSFTLMDDDMFEDVMKKMGTKEWKSRVEFPLDQMRDLDSYDDRSHGYDISWQLIRLLRNFVAHFSEVKTVQIGACEAEALIMTLFGRELIALQNALATTGCDPNRADSKKLLFKFSYSSLFKPC